MGGPTARVQSTSDFQSVQQSAPAGQGGSAQKSGRRTYQKKERGGGKRGPNKNPQSSKAESQIGETNSADQSAGVGPSGAQSIQHDFAADGQAQTQAAGALGEEGKSVVIVAPSGGVKKRGQNQSQGENGQAPTKASRSKSTANDAKSGSAPKQGSKSKDSKRKLQSQEANDDYVDPSQSQSVDPGAPGDNLDFVEPDQPALNPTTSQMSTKGQKASATRAVKESGKKQRNPSSQSKNAAGAANTYNNSQ